MRITRHNPSILPNHGLTRHNNYMLPRQCEGTDSASLDFTHHPIAVAVTRRISNNLYWEAAAAACAA